ncbi:MAG: nucleotidyltransferase family protein [Flavobacteriaceae bacterium]
MSDITLCILAAGASRRMPNHIKQLLPWKNTTLLGNAIAQAKQVTNSIVVVLGSNATQIKRVVPNDVLTLQNSNWEAGMGNSISVAARHVLDSKKIVSGMLIMLSDQPFIDSMYLSELIAAFRHKKPKIVATDYGLKLGVPAIFHFSLLAELSELHQDFGAKDIIRKYKGEIIKISPNGKEVDIDTIKKYNQLIDNK